MRMIFSRQVCLKFLQCIWALMLGSCGIGFAESSIQHLRLCRMGLHSQGLGVSVLRSFPLNARGIGLFGAAMI